MNKIKKYIYIAVGLIAFSVAKTSTGIYPAIRDAAIINAIVFFFILKIPLFNWFYSFYFKYKIIKFKKY